MSNVALYTFGLIDPAAGPERMNDFAERARLVFEASVVAAGFIGRAERAAERRYPDKPGDDFGPWGLYALPLDLPDFAGQDPTLHLATLSLWQDTESARRFTYGGLHREALKIRHDWFLKGPWPGHVLWGVADDVIPRWSDGASRLQDLARQGDTAEHFTFGFR